MSANCTVVVPRRLCRAWRFAVGGRFRKPHLSQPHSHLRQRLRIDRAAQITYRSLRTRRDGLGGHQPGVKCVVSKIQMQFGLYSTQSGNCLRTERPGPWQRPEMLVSKEKHPPHARRRHPHPAQVGTAVRELTMGAVGLAPLVEQRQDLGVPRTPSSPCAGDPPGALSTSCPRARRAIQRCARTSPSSSS